MKDNEIDRLFRQKLEGFQQEPSPHAWQQLEDQLQQKKERKWFFYLPGIAASLLLLAGLWAVFEYSAAYLPADTLSGDPKPKVEKEIHQKEQTISRNTPEPKGQTNPAHTQAEEEEEEEQGALAKIENAEPAAKEKEGKGNHKAETNPKQEPAKKIQEEPLASLDNNRPEHLKKETTRLKEAERIPLNNSFSDQLTAVALQPIEAEPTEEIIIHYRADDSEKEDSTNNGNSLTEAQTDEEKEFSAKKVIGFLSKVKRNSNANLAELREAKDELLSFRIGKSNEKN